MNTFLTIIFVFAFFIWSSVVILNIANRYDCTKKGGVYASPHCFKKESLME
jgi:hypothetical protein